MASIWLRIFSRPSSTYYAIPYEVKAVGNADPMIGPNSCEDVCNHVQVLAPQRRLPFLSRLLLLLTLVNMAMLACSLAKFMSASDKESTGLNHSLKQVSLYSPVLENTEIPLVNKQIEGGLFSSSNPLLGRLKPGATTDELWGNIENIKQFALSRQQLLAMGKDPKTVSKLPDKDFGLGDEAYMGALDIFHVLHCFDEVRKEAFKDYFWDGEKYQMEEFTSRWSHPPKRTHDPLFWIHLLHCTDIVTQNLMCNADLTVIPYVWMETQQAPWPEFSVNKKCRDFDTIVRWRDENALDKNKTNAIRKPHGVVNEERMDDMYWELYGEAGEHVQHVHK